MASSPSRWPDDDDDELPPLPAEWAAPAAAPDDPDPEVDVSDQEMAVLLGRTPPPTKPTSPPKPKAR